MDILPARMHFVAVITDGATKIAERAIKEARASRSKTPGMEPYAFHVTRFE